jgi:hypothetical protein
MSCKRTVTVKRIIADVKDKSESPRHFPAMYGLVLAAGKIEFDLMP